MASKNGKSNGAGVSRRSLPKTKEIDLREDAPSPARRAPRLKVGDRVQKIGGTPSGIVRLVRRGEAQIHWGTADNREVVSWTPLSELERFTEKVADADEILKREKK